MGETGAQIEELENELRSILSVQRIDGLTRLSGGASRETWSFEADGRALVLQRQRPGDGRDMGVEAAVLSAAFSAGVPVPELIASGVTASGARYMIMAHVPGETIARKILRDERFTRSRQNLVPQMARAMARLHAVDVADISQLPATDQVSQYRATLDDLNASLGQSHPTFELAFRWLETNRPSSRRSTLVHGDFRLGNVMVDDSGLAAVLDWELAHVGDPLEDLGWLCVRAWRFGSVLPVAGLAPYETLLDEYRAASGFDVNARDVLWWEVLGTLKWGIMCMIQASSHLLGLLRSHEMAAIGRRVCENEYDLLVLLDGKWSATSTTSDPRTWTPRDEDVEPMVTVHDVPTAGQLVESVREWLEKDVVSGTSGRLQFLARVAVNSLAIVEREMRVGTPQTRRHLARLADLGVDSDAELAREIRSGRFDDRLDVVAEVVRHSVVDKVHVANPKYLIT